MTTVVLDASNIGGTINTAYSGTVTVGSDGRITVDTRDVPSLLAAGATYQSAPVRSSTVTTPATASSALVVNSASLANGTLSIAAQPGVLRPLVARIDAGGGTITAGTLAMAYVANNGVAETDRFALAGTSVVLNTTTYGVATLTSAIVTALAGGTSPKVEIGTNAALALPVDSGFSNLSVKKTTVDAANEGIGTVNSTGGFVTPSTAPNGTHNYQFVYTYTAPNS